MDLNRGTLRWKRRPTFHLNYRRPLLLTSFFLIVTALFISLKTLFCPSPFPLSRDSGHILHSPCANAVGEKFLWYAPHSGFSNQLSEFKNAILMAAILNRTLIVPPVLDHHAVALGSCPKFRVLDPNELRFKVWNHSIQLIRERRYISMADIIDISSIVSTSYIKFIDFRVFVMTWCGVNINLACDAHSSTHSSLLENLKRCGSLLSGHDGNVATCLFASQEDCRTAVWTYQKDDDGFFDSFQADDEVRKKRKISYSRKRKDVYKALGPGSAAGSATVLAFGSLFTALYKGSESHVDIREAPKNQRIQSLIQKIEFLPFASEISRAGKKFAVQTIKAPFLCAQLRLLDGQFKNHRESTFIGLKQKLELLKSKGPIPVHVFVMSDLPFRNWSGSYLGDLAKDDDVYKLFVLREEDEIVTETSRKIVNAGHGMKLREQRCGAVTLPDIRLYLEETICSCAYLGFVGTAGSTIAESIGLMRKHSVCS